MLIILKLLRNNFLLRKRIFKIVYFHNKSDVNRIEKNKDMQQFSNDLKDKVVINILGMSKKFNKKFLPLTTSRYLYCNEEKLV
jgi:ribosomal protein S24E